MAVETRGSRKKMAGVVTSDKMDKTVVVRVDSLVKHIKYKKIMRVSKKYKAHDEGNTCKTGDRVMIQEHRPLSREKRWRVVKIIERASE
jgi:small subunit ribosomal protein S17